MGSRQIAIAFMSTTLTFGQAFAASVDCAPYDVIKKNSDYLTRQTAAVARSSKAYADSVDAYYRIYDRMLIADRVGDSEGFNMVAREFKDCTGDVLKKRTLTWSTLEAQLPPEKALQLKKQLEEAAGKPLVSDTVLEVMTGTSMMGVGMAMVGMPIAGGLIVVGSVAVGVVTTAAKAVAGTPLFIRKAYFRATGHDERVQLHTLARELATNQVDGMVGTKLKSDAAAAPAVISEGTR